MPRLQRKSLDVPETVRRFEHGSISSVSLDEMAIGYFHLEPGWRWSNDVRPIVGTESCQHRHLGICLQGTLHVELADGTTTEIGPNDAYEIPPGHDAWVKGESAWISYEWASSRVFAQAPEDDGDGILATLLFTDIVDSTSTAERIGDKAWRELILAHNAAIRSQLDHHRGRELDTTGDGFLAMFDSASRAVRCALKVARAAEDLGLGVRVGCHTGEISLVAGRARGVAVHTAARVMAIAPTGGVVVSRNTRDLLGAADFDIESAGTFELKGLSGDRELFHVRHGAR
jgi:class 3 adenylate cyclase